VNKALIAFLSVCVFFSASAQERKQSVAVLPTVDSKTTLNPESQILLTDRVREIAIRTLPQNDFILLRQDVISNRLGGDEELFKSCKEGTCIGELTKRITADYGARCEVSKIDDNRLSLKFELYRVKDDAILETFSKYPIPIKDALSEILAVLEKRLPNAFKKMLGFRITFHENNGSGTVPETRTVNPGNTITIPNQGGLTRTGYIFDGWNIDSSGTGINYRAGSSYKPASDVTLYAKWNAMTTYTVTFHPNNGRGVAPGTQFANAGNAITVPDQRGLTRSGYYFDGWNTNSSGTGDSYGAGSSYMPVGNITLYAKWNTISTNVVYTIKFNPNGGSGWTSSIRRRVSAGSAITIPNQGSLTRNGYILDGWSTDSSGTGDNYGAGSSYTPTADITLYAKWDSTNTYMVTFDANNGKGFTPSTQTVNAGFAIALPNLTGILTRRGYTFGGWNTDSSGTGDNYDAGLFYTPTGNVTLYAKWNTPMMYTVTLNFNDGSDMVTGPRIVSKIHTVNVGSAIMLPHPPDGMVRNGYTFSGWNTNSFGTGLNYRPGSYYAPKSNVTLYAKWNQVKRKLFK